MNELTQQIERLIAENVAAKGDARTPYLDVAQGALRTAASHLQLAAANMEQHGKALAAKAPVKPAGK